MKMKRESHPYPEFATAVRNLAPTIEEIAAIMGVSPRSVAGYLSGTALPHTKIIKQLPAIDDALTRDFAAIRAIPARSAPSLS